MRKFKIKNIKTLHNIKSDIELNSIIELVPVIKKNYKLGSKNFRCTEHKIGYVVLKEEFIILELQEIFN